MAKIDAQTINDAYDLAKRVYAGQVPEPTAISELIHVHAMNEASATIYIRNLATMLDGKILKRTMSMSSFSIYLDRIAEDYGSLTANVAIGSVRSHVEYYNSLGRGNLVSVSAICDAAQAALAGRRAVP